MFAQWLEVFELNLSKLLGWSVGVTSLSAGIAASETPLPTAKELATLMAGPTISRACKSVHLDGYGLRDLGRPWRDRDCRHRIDLVCESVSRVKITLIIGEAATASGQSHRHLRLRRSGAHRRCDGAVYFMTNSASQSFTRGLAHELDPATSPRIWSSPGRLKPT